jgi:transposase InsO family protein
MSGTGNCYDNAPTESFFGSLKTEHVHHSTLSIRHHSQYLKENIFTIAHDNHMWA